LYFQRLTLVYGNRYDLNLEISRLIRIVENLFAIAKRKKIADPLAFIKETFKLTVRYN
jgi:hypothetical protein